MLAKSKLFLVAECIDDSIKLRVPTYDITLFKNFVSLEKYIETTPVMIETLVITTNELPFTATNMEKLMRLLKSPFLKITGNVVYLVDRTYDVRDINKLLEMKGITEWAIYQNEITPKFVTDIVSGVGRESNEGQVEIVTYRIRASEYVKQQNTLKYENTEGKFLTDEDLLSNVPNEEEPEDIVVSEDFETTVNYIVGQDSYERTLMVFTLAQYLSQTDKTIIVERDVKYHKLTEMVTKAGVDCELILIDSMFENVSETLLKIKGTDKKLVVLGAIDRFEYDYNFIMDLLMSNLKGSFAHIIRECDYEETPYNKTYTIVIKNTVPSLLECVSSLKYDIDEDRVTFVGMQIGDLGPVNLTSKEMENILKRALEKNRIAAQVVKARGVVLKGEEVIYDILSILNRANRG